MTTALSNRREFCGGLAALVLGGCAAPPARPVSSGSARPAAKAVEPRYTAPSSTTLPMLEVRGTPYDIGCAVGRRFAKQIRGGLEARGKWFQELKAFADAQPASLYDTFVAAAKKHAPAVWEELRGWARGSGVPLRDLMILNLKAEYGAMRDSKKCSGCEGPSGCSTVVLAVGGEATKLLVAHNEDGHQAYEGKMFMLRMHPTGQPSVLCATYPGILPGNAPWINDQGIAMTTNFIYSRAVRPGVGRYFLDRLAMTAKTLEQATEICKHPQRAYAFHHVLGAVKERKIRSLEVTPRKHSQQDISGLFVHTNHLVHPALAAEPQDARYVATSSSSRWKVLTRWRDAQKQPASLTGTDLVAALASHERRPYSPCRHPQGEVQGSTLLTALLDIDKGTMRVYKGQPCEGKTHDYQRTS